MVLPASNDDSLITSIAFRRTYVQAHPGADSIVVTKDWPKGQVTALALYADGQKVFVHDAAGTDRVLEGLTPADLYRPSMVQIALQENHVAEIPGHGGSNSAANFADQLERDFSALKTVNVIAALHPASAGQEGLLAYEWDDQHYTFTSASGCRRYVPPVNPLTGQPCLCLNHGDIFESIAFIVEYRRAHPDEKAVLVLPEIHHAPEVILPAVAFTKGTGIFVHSAILGDVALDGFKAENISDSKAIFSAYRHLLEGLMKSRGIKFPMELTKTQLALPDAMPGDSDEMQFQRALARMRRLGIVSDIIRANSAKKIRAHMMLEFDGLQYSWSCADRVSYYNGIGDKPAVNSFIHGMIFVSNFLKEHPGEKAFCYPCAPLGPLSQGSLVATTVYTLDGKVFSHHQQTGDLEIPLLPADLTDFEKVISVSRKIYRAAYAAQLAGRRVGPPANLPAFDQSLFQLEPIARELTACGVQSRLVPIFVKTESGHEMQRRVLAFEWAGKSYSYSAEQGCFSTASSGTTPAMIIAQK